MRERLTCDGMLLSPARLRVVFGGGFSKVLLVLVTRANIFVCFVTCNIFIFAAKINKF